jgi:hypothetical protein
LPDVAYKGGWLASQGSMMGAKVGAADEKATSNRSSEKEVESVPLSKLETISFAYTDEAGYGSFSCIHTVARCERARTLPRKTELGAPESQTHEG